MNRFRWIGLFGVVVWLAVGCANAEDSAEKASEEKAVVIPLSEIWAYDMPGTRDIRKLQASKLPPSGDGLLVAQIRRSLSKDRPKGEVATAGFAVLSTGLEALREAHAVLVQGRKPRKSFPAGSNISLVFFSHESSYYVKLHKVTRQESAISVRYRFVPHLSKELTTHFALIPIGKNDAGKYEVQMVRIPMERRFTNAGFKEDTTKWESRIVCDSFKFEILETDKD